MRLRHVRGGRALLEAHPQLITLDAPALRGQWRAWFPNPGPLHLEIGMGKGRFLTGLARQSPEVNHLGMEKFDSVAVRALQRLQADPLPNVRLALACASTLDEAFAPGELDRIYLNFSDPWPKKAHAKRRLTHPTFLERYRRALAPAGALHLKTDNRGLFEFTLLQLSQENWRLERVSLDLHAQEPEDNVRTEYEAAFAAEGHPIYALVARP